ncbi:alkaline phosphatase [Victivallaceae bacterium BBE-744-WT-12]|uniref:Alkaline phosphatase n=2 Tax=Victivallis lenta TaxID=2606640 RepID=A0A844FZ37_9BACT|nr:alkaline phosphatase [Victivallales bacterium CCUG 44730]MST96376.1 alkaline phosphatase [Victivallis lenta]
MAGGDDRKNFALEPYEVKSMKQLRLFAAVCAALLAVAAPAAGLEKPKYIFLFIGDGMGAPQVSLAAEFCGKPQLFDGFETVGLTATRSLNSYITDSAAAGTALASGSKTNSGMVGRAPDGTPLPSYVIAAREKGRKVGVVTSVSLDHATPAAFYANVPSRSNYYDIAVQMGRSGIDYLAGGGLLRPAGKKKDRPDAYRLAEENGYTVVRTVDAFDALKRGAGKTIVISPEPNRTASLPYAIDRRDGVPTLAALTARGIELLDNPNGFFLMVEGGMIDWACHANDAATAVAETLAFRDAVAEAVRFADAHPDETLIIVTADHETGGLTLGQRTLPYGSRYGLLKAQKVSFQAFSDELRELKKRDVLTPERMRRLVTERFGLRFDGTGPLVLADEEKNELDQALEASLHPSAESKLRCGGYEPLAVAATRILAAKAGIGWTTYAHTALPVMTFARGVNAELFSNYYDNTHIAELIRAML